MARGYSAYFDLLRAKVDVDDSKCEKQLDDH